MSSSIGWSRLRCAQCSEAWFSLLRCASSSFDARSMSSGSANAGKCSMAASSSSSSRMSPGSLIEREIGRAVLRLGDDSGSLKESSKVGLDDFFTSFLVRESERVRLLLFDSTSDSSSSTDVAAVSVDGACEKRDMLLPFAVDMLPVYAEERLAVVLVRLLLLVEPPNRSLATPGRELNRLREMTSNPNMAARDLFAVGVVGLEFCPVLNLNSPYWWTAGMVSTF